MKLDNGAYQTLSSVLLNNGGFESGLTGWTILNSNGATISADNLAADAHTGNGSMKVVNPTAQTGNQWKVQVTSAAFPTTIGKQYTISYWVRAATAGGSIRLSTGPTGAQYQADQTIGTAWQQVSWTITASLTSTTILFDMGQVARTYYIDDASVKEAGSGGGSWQWIKLLDASLSAGSHTLTLGYRDGNAKLDKVLITTYSDVITGKGGAASNACAVCTAPVGNRLYVNAANLPGGGGADWSCAYNQLYDAFAYANTHAAVSEIWITGGTCKPRDNGNRGETFGLNRYGIRVVGGFSGTETSESQANNMANPTILSGNVGSSSATDNSNHLFIFYNPAYSGPLVFKGLTMQDGNAGDIAGVAYVAYLNNLTFDSCTFKNNYAPTGGAFYIDNTPVLFSNCRFENNTAPAGGAIFSFQASPMFTRSVFSGNSAGSGGAYYGNYGQPMFRDIVFSKNTASGDGGAVYQNHMSTDYFNCVLDSNFAAVVGGALFVHNGMTAGLLNSTLHGNRANNIGGAIFADYNGASITALNTIFWGNSRNGNTASSGSDFYSYDFSASIFRNSMLQDNSMVPADNGTNRINNIRGVAAAFTNESYTSGLDGKWYTGDDGLQLSCNSAVPSIVIPQACGAGINSGDNSLATANGLTTDIMGNARIMCGTIDRGAYEAQNCTGGNVAETNDAVIAGILNAKMTGSAKTGLLANPFTGELLVQYAGSEKAVISVVSPSGKIVAVKTNAAAGTHRFDAAGWGTGLYIITITTADKKAVTLKAVKL